MHKSINSTALKTANEQVETIWAKLILTSQQNIIIGACYRPNVNDKTTVPVVKKILDDILNQQHRNIVLAGDFNLQTYMEKKQCKKKFFSKPS